MHPEQLQRKVREHGAHIGIAHDGDADRLILCDEKGELIDGDDIMAIAGLDMLAQGTLAKSTLVTTVMSNAGLDAAIKAAGGHVLRTPVGDKYVIDEMLRHGFNFGGEQSGHMIFGDFSTTGDGLVSALQILRIMKARESSLSKLARCWKRFPQRVTNVRVREKRPFDKFPDVLELVAQAEAEVTPTAAASSCATPARNPRPACSSKAATTVCSSPGRAKSARPSSATSGSKRVAADVRRRTTGTRRAPIPGAFRRGGAGQGWR